MVVLLWTQTYDSLTAVLVGVRVVNPSPFLVAFCLVWCGYPTKLGSLADGGFQLSSFYHFCYIGVFMELFFVSI